MSSSTLAAQIGELVGGPENVSQVQTCATRLRFRLKDPAKARKSDLNNVKGVLQVVEQGGQTQVVIGPQVGDVYQALSQLPGWAAAVSGGGDAEQGGGQRGSVLNRIFDFLAGTFQPLLWPLIGASMVKMLLGVAAQFGWYDPSAPSAAISVLAAAGNSVFYFLPVFVAITSARKLGANPFLAGAIVAALLEPSFLKIGQIGDIASFFGLPLYVFSYSSAVFPPILASIALAYLERGLKRIVPKNFQLILIPTVALAVLVPVTALVFGPIGVVFGNAVASFITWVSGISPVLLTATFAAGYMFLVMFGLQWALLPVVLANLSSLGGDPLLAVGGVYNFAVFGLAVGVFLRAKRDVELRELAGAGAAAGLLAGISEPILYGIILRFKRVIPIVVVGSVAGGVIAGLFDVRASAIAFGSLFTIPIFLPTLGYVFAIAVSFAVGLGGVLIFGYKGSGVSSEALPADSELSQAGAAPRGHAGSTLSATGLKLATKPFTVSSPVTGSLIPLEQVPDPVFAGGLVGPGVAVVPTTGTVVAPADGTIIVAPPTGHAVGMRTVDGAEILVHVGIDTVQLGGVGFTALVHNGQQVSAGQKLIEFDLDAISRAGLSPVTPVLVTNAAAFDSVVPVTTEQVGRGAPLLTITPMDQEQ
jgi:PTS system beta-glucosides-specific IIC component